MLNLTRSDVLAKARETWEKALGALQIENLPTASSRAERASGIIADATIEVTHGWVIGLYSSLKRERDKLHEHCHIMASLSHALDVATREGKSRDVGCLRQALREEVNRVYDEIGPPFD